MTDIQALSPLITPQIYCFLDEIFVEILKLEKK